MAPARFSPRSGSSDTLAHWQEPVLVSVGTLGLSCRGAGYDTAILAHRTEVERRHAGGLLTPVHLKFDDRDLLRLREPAKFRLLWAKVDA